MKANFAVGLFMFLIGVALILVMIFYHPTQYPLTFFQGVYVGQISGQHYLKISIDSEIFWIKLEEDD